MPAYYPVYLDLRDRRCVVIGGGQVGEEKVARLLDCGANVTVISPQVTDGLRALAEGDRLEWIQRKYEPGSLEDAFIAIVVDTSDRELNSQVSKEARARNIPLNVNDVTELCTWIAPAVVKRGEVTVAISTGGASPALARRFREELSGTGRVKSRHGVMEYADLAELLSEAREELSGKGITLMTDHWQACLTDDLVDLVQAGERDEAKSLLMSRLLVGADCDCQGGVCRMWEELAPVSAAGNGPSPSSPI